MRGDWKRGNAGGRALSITVLIRHGSMGEKASENLPSAEVMLYVKLEVDACKNVSVMPRHTGAQTDRRTCPYVLD